MKSFYALDLAIKFYSETRELRLPPHLKNQFDRACSSVSMNLSEGSAKPTKADRRKFYYIALGSTRECQMALKLHGAPPELCKQAEFLAICIYKLCVAMR